MPDLQAKRQPHPAAMGLGRRTAEGLPLVQQDNKEKRRQTKEIFHQRVKTETIFLA